VVNKFLFLAYAFVWILFMLYAWSLSRRQSRLSKELEDLKSRTGSNATVVSTEVLPPAQQHQER
jgi:CcmD family protein